MHPACTALTGGKGLGSRSRLSELPGTLNGQDFGYLTGVRASVSSTSFPIYVVHWTPPFLGRACDETVTGGSRMAWLPKSVLC